MGIEWMLSSVVLIMMMLLIRWLFKNKINAALRYFLWLIVLIRLLVPVSFAANSASVLNLIPLQNRQNESAELQENNTYAEVVGGEGVFKENKAHGDLDRDSDKVGKFEGISSPWDESKESLADVREPVHETNALPEEKINWKKAAVAIWIAGMTVTAAVLLAANIHFYLKLKRSRRSFAEEEAKVTEVLQKPFKVPVYVTKAVSTPCLFGFFLPAIYIRPEDVESGKLYYIFRHELTHYKHGDHIWALLRSVSLVLHWYNPFVWVAAYLSKQDSELACDETVIAKMSEAEKQEYGRLLISLSVKRVNYKERFSCATTMTGGKKSLKERIMRIAHRPKMMLVSVVAVMLLCVSIITMTFTGAKEQKVLRNEETGQEQRFEGAQSSQVVQSSEDEETSGDENAADRTASSEETVMEEKRIFVNDFLLDMNGDGVRDIVRLESLDLVNDPVAITADKERLLESLRKNVGSYMELRLYDGVLACDNMDNFRPGDEIAADSLVEVLGDCAHAHSGNKQYSYYVEEGKGCIVCNIPYCGQGVGAYGYEVFTYNRNWERVTKAENSLEFTIEPWQPERYMDGEFGTYFERNFPIEEMIDYTLELKEHLDKATIMVDTGTGEIEEFQVATHFDAERMIPDAYDIWHWYTGNTLSGIPVENVQTAEELRRALEGIRMQNWLVSQNFLAEDNKPVKVQSALPPKDALPAGLQSDFDELKWECTWNLNGREVDVYSYRADNSLSMYLIYDRESGQHFIMDGNDVSLQEQSFIMDMIRSRWDLFENIYANKQ